MDNILHFSDGLFHDNYDIICDAACLLIRDGHLRVAYKLLEPLLRVNPNSHRARIALAMVYYRCLCGRARLEGCRIAGHIAYKPVDGSWEPALDLMGLGDKFIDNLNIAILNAPEGNGEELKSIRDNVIRRSNIQKEQQ